MFKVGDYIVANRGTWGVKEGDVVRVVVGYEQETVGVETQEVSNGHSCDGSGKDGCCWWVNPDLFTLHSVDLENK